MNDFESACKSYRLRIERALAARLPAADTAGRLGEAMRYACLNGGKRFRAMLVYACGEIAGASADVLDGPAAAVEMVHAYSLVHDDLPAMDDDDLRRGRPTCHLAYDESTAILAGDALHSLAFAVLGAERAPTLPPERRLRMVETLARAAGAQGMAGGQMLDMRATGQTAQSSQSAQPPDLAHLSHIHRLKTGALIRAAARLGGLASARADDELRQLLARLDEYAANIGLAFQIVDDILDAEAGTSGATLGKRGGADRRMQKTTYIDLLGLDNAKIEARDLSQNAVETAALLGDNGRFLAQLARFVVNRSF